MSAHLLISHIPLEFLGETREAVCGKMIPCAQLAFLWDEVKMGKLDLDSLRVCPKCVLRFADWAGESYLYGIVKGERR